MQFFIALLFLQFFTLDGFKTWYKPHSIRLTSHALLDSLGVVNGDEYARQKDLNAPLKSLLPRSIRWELMYRATVDYCQQHQQLPAGEYLTNFDGHDDLYLGRWVSHQKQRYDGDGEYSASTVDQLNKMMAIAEFRMMFVGSLCIEQQSIIANSINDCHLRDSRLVSTDMM